MIAKRCGKPDVFFCKTLVFSLAIKLSTAVDKPVDNSFLSRTKSFHLIYAKLPKAPRFKVLGGPCELIWGIPMAGKLYIVGTPIGNLEDISSRVKRILGEVDLVFAEDTRVSIKLMSHLGLSKSLVSCHDFNEEKRAAELERIAAENKAVALISDAGTPLISDPGYKFVQKAIALGIDVIGIPGPSAVMQALVASGIPCERFSFEGFLPEKGSSRRKRLEHLKNDDRTLVFFLPITDIQKVLPEINEIMGNRKACLCRELTKKHEEYIRANVLDLLAIAQQRELKGECVLVLAGKDETMNVWTDEEIQTKLEDLLSSGARLKDAARIIANESGRSSSDIYKLGLQLKE